VGRLAVLQSTPKSEYVTAMNYITLPALVAPILGPLVGGYLTTFWSWHYIFYLNVPISIICIILARHNMPKDEVENRKRSFDLPGFIMSGLGFAGFMYGIEMFSQQGVRYWLPVTVLLVSSALIYLNFKLSRHKSNPLINYSVMKIQTYRITVTVGTITRVVIGVAPYLIPLMFQEAFGLSPFESGSLFVATMVGNLCMKTATVYTIRHFPFRTIIIVNGFFIALFTLLTAFLLPTTPVYLIVIVMFLSGMTRSMQFTSITTLAFANIPPEMMNAANSLYSTIQQISAGMGIAIGAVFLRFANIINQGTSGRYTVPDFRLSFIFVAVLALVHLYAYAKLPRDAGDAVRNKK
jgi:MFS family permease